MTRCLTILPSRGTDNGNSRDSDLLRHVFEATVERCLKEGLVSGEGLAVDASLILRRNGRVPKRAAHTSPVPRAT